MAEKLTMSKPYAKAIFDLACESKQLDKWAERLNVLAQVVEDENMKQILGNPKVSEELVVDILKSSLKDDQDAQLENAIRLVIENGKALIFPEIYQTYHELMASIEGTVEAEVTSAYAITAAQKKQISTALSKRFNSKDISITSNVDKSIIGGVIIKVGDLVIDGSITSQLEKITRTLTR